MVGQIRSEDSRAALRRCAADNLLAEFEPQLRSTADLAEQIQQALQSPLGYPGLNAATIPGDHIVFALGRDIVDTATILQAVIDYFQANELTDRYVQFLLPSNFADDALAKLQDIAKSHKFVTSVVRHDPGDAKAHAFLTSNHDNRAIVLSRPLCDADVVIPVHRALDPKTFRNFGPFSVIYPEYTDADSRRRWNSPGFVTRPERRKRRINDVEEVRQLMGVVYSLALLPGRDFAVQSAWFGEAELVSQASQSFLAEHWNGQLEKQPGVVLAQLGGTKEQQTWENAARVLSNVEHVVPSNGAVVLCCDINVRPGTSMMRMAESLELHDFEQANLKSRLPDAATAMQFARTLSQCKVYFYGPLPESTLDDLDLIPVQNEAELKKICDHYGDVAVVYDAQDLRVQLTDVESAVPPSSGDFFP